MAYWHSVVYMYIYCMTHIYGTQSERDAYVAMRTKKSLNDIALGQYQPIEDITLKDIKKEYAK